MNASDFLRAFLFIFSSSKPGPAWPRLSLARPGGSQKSALHTTLEEGDTFCTPKLFREQIWGLHTKLFYVSKFFPLEASMHSYFAAKSFKPYFIITENLNCTKHKLSGGSFTTKPTMLLLHSMKWQLPNKNLSIVVPM